MSWLVLYTRSRYEKAVAEKLTSAGMEVYLPILRKKKKWSDRWKWIEEPLFRSYCFVNLEEKDRDKVFGIPGVVRYLYHCGKPAVVQPYEIDLLKKWLNEYSHDSIGISEFQINNKVLVGSGIFMDEKAEVAVVDGNFLTLILESFGVKIRVDLRKNIVEKLDS